MMVVLLTGALMEIARVLGGQKTETKMTYWFVFFDGEEAFCFDWDDSHNRTPPIPGRLYQTTRTAAADMWPN